MKKQLFFIFAIFLSCFVSSQSISPSVINSGGRSYTASIGTQTIIYTDNIGEAIIGTNSNNGTMVTQGFLQPFTAKMNNASVTVYTSNVSCSDKRDGFIHVEVLNPPAGSTFKYFWTPNALCPTHDCPKEDSLSAGTFTVRTVCYFANGDTNSVQYSLTITDVNGLCDLKVYTGVQLSGGNPKFTIDNIELYPDAKVSIYNRWGGEVFSRVKYNNVDNYWPAKGDKVVPGTYFYIIDAGKLGTKKSWLEVFE